MNTDNYIKLQEIENISTLSELLEELEKQNAIYEVETFKNEYTLVFVDLGGYYKYSVLVFNADKKHLRYCDNYELHFNHMNYTHEQLKARYIEGLTTTIYTVAELLEPDSDYTSQELKRYFLHNYYYANCDYVSAFCIKGTPDEKELEGKKKNLVYDPLQFCYVSDPEKVKAHIELYKKMESCFVSDSYEYWFKAFKHEMYNHEYAINYQGDWDVISCFVRLGGKYSENTEELLNRANFTETQKKAYRAAARIVCNDDNCY